MAGLFLWLKRAYKAGQSRDPFLDGIQVGRIRDADVGVGAEGCAGNQGHVLLFQKTFAKLDGIQFQRADVGKDVESSQGPGDVQSRNFAKARVEHVAAMFKGPAHGLHLVVWTFERRNGAVLRKGVGAGGGLRLDVNRGFDDVFRSRRVPKSPTRSRKRLAETVAGDGQVENVIVQAADADVFFIVVDQFLVDFIRDDGDVVG